MQSHTPLLADEQLHLYIGLEQQICLCVFIVNISNIQQQLTEWCY